MKAAVIVAVVVSIGIGVAVYAATRSTPERIVCTKVGKLCGESGGDLGDLNECVADMEKISARIGEERMKKTAECVDESKTCAAVVGCMAGTGVNVMQEVLGDFLKGFGRTLFPGKKK